MNNANPSAEHAPLRTEADAVAFLNSLIDYEKWTGAKAPQYGTKTFDRDAFRALLARLGNPQVRYAVVHVAGTKGKGSTCAMIEAALRGAGLRTGMYTSPHLNTYRERIRVNGEMISGEDFARRLEGLRGAGAFGNIDAAESDDATQHPGFRTVFEYLTAAALVHFAESGVDVAVVETGLGGRLDSTNCFGLADADVRALPPLVNVITTMGLDHCEILGHDILSIAREKVAIWQPRAAALVVGVQRPEFRADVLRAVEERRTALGADAAQVLDVEALCDVQDVPSAANDLESAEVAEFRLPQLARTDAPEGSLARWLHGGVALRLPLRGAHQRDNMRTALVAVLALEQAWQKFDAVRTVCGLLSADWPGRMERVRGRSPDVPMYVDGAHCPLSADALARAVAASHPGAPVIALVGVMRDKDAAAMLRAFAAHVAVVHWHSTSPPSPRGLPAEDLAAIIRTISSDANFAPDIPSAVEAARAADGVIVAFGSLHLIDTFRAALAEA